MENQANELFTAYMDGTLSVSERKSFEIRLAEDASLSKEFGEFKNIYGVLKNRYSPERASVLESINKADARFNFENETQQPKGRVISFRPWQYGVAATILLAIGLFLFNNFSKPTYADFATHENISLTLRGDTDSLTKKAETAYNAANYKEAIPYFDALLKKNPKNIQLQYYKAKALVEMDNFNEADSLLQSISEGNSVYAFKARWLAALSKLKQKQYDEVKEILRTIPSVAPEYKKAQKLLNGI
jgi:tetratricopeptide (TPR) repeat protein